MIQNDIWPCFYIQNTFVNPLYPLRAKKNKNMIINNLQLNLRFR